MAILDTLDMEKQMLCYVSQFDKCKSNYFDDLLQKYDGSEECKNDDISIKAREDGNKHYQKKNLMVGIKSKNYHKIISFHKLFRML